MSRNMSNVKFPGILTLTEKSGRPTKDYSKFTSVGFLTLSLYSPLQTSSAVWKCHQAV